jgi:hypothetical protein
MTTTQPQSQTADTGPTVSVNVPLPAELHRRVKMAAAADGLTVKEAVILALQMWVTNG